MLRSLHDKPTKIAPPRPFPWRCQTCGNVAVEPGAISYEGEIYHDGVRHRLTIPALRLPVCRACGEPSFTGAADDQISAALRAHLHLLTPEEIHSAIEQLEIAPEDIAAHIGVSEEQLSFWIDGVQIQSRAMDNVLRIYFGFPEVRQALRTNNWPADYVVGK